MANLRALGEIQRRGLEAANLVVGRLIAQIDQGTPLFGAEPIVAPADGPAPSSVPDVSELVGQYASLMSSFISALLGAQGPFGAAGTAGTAAAATGPTSPSAVRADPLVLPPTSPGGLAEGELWLHNRSGAAVTGVRVHCGDLRRHDGWAIPSSAIRFDPDCVEELSDLTSRGLRVAVDVPVDTPPGTYRGTVLAANLPDLWLVVELDVVAAP